MKFHKLFSTNRFIGWNSVLLNKFILHNQNKTRNLWRFDLFQRPSSQEAGTQSLIHLVGRSGTLSITVACAQFITWFSWIAWSVRADLLCSERMAGRWLFLNVRICWRDAVRLTLCRTQATPVDESFLRISRSTFDQLRWWFQTDRSSSALSWPAAASSTTSRSPGSSSCCISCARNSSPNRCPRVSTIIRPTYCLRASSVYHQVSGIHPASAVVDGVRGRASVNEETDDT